MTINDKKWIFKPGDITIKHKAPTVANSSLVSYKPNNYVANFSIPENHQNGYEDIVKFFHCHPLHYAMTGTPSFMYPHMLMEFWYTCEYNSTRNFIKGYVCNGKYTVRVTVNCLRDVLKLAVCETFDPLVDETTTDKILSIIGYNFPTGEEKKGYILRQRMTALWSYMFGNVIRSLGSKVGSYNQANEMEMQILHSMIKGKDVDYAELIFNELKKQVVKEPRGGNVPYTRFLSLVFENLLGNKYAEVEMEYVPPNMTGSRIFDKLIQPTDRKITTAMRWQIDNPYVSTPFQSEEEEKDNQDCLKYMAKKKKRARRNTDTNTPKKKQKFRSNDAEKRYNNARHQSQDDTISISSGNSGDEELLDVKQKPCELVEDVSSMCDCVLIDDSDDGAEELLNVKKEQSELVGNVSSVSDSMGRNSSPQCGIICVQGYKVKQSVAPILEAIFKKHGDIAAKCIFKTPSMKTSVLESVCEVITRIQSNEVYEKMEEIESQVSDVEAANINVSWLRAHLEAIHKRKQGMKKSSLLLEMKVNTILVNRAAQKDLRERCAELLASQERFGKAERCVRVLHLFEKNLNNKILESKAEKDPGVVQPLL